MKIRYHVPLFKFLSDVRPFSFCEAFCNASPILWGLILWRRPHSLRHYLILWGLTLFFKDGQILWGQTSYCKARPLSVRPGLILWAQNSFCEPRTHSVRPTSISKDGLISIPLQSASLFQQIIVDFQIFGPGSVSEHCSRAHALYVSLIWYLSLV